MGERLECRWWCWHWHWHGCWWFWWRWQRRCSGLCPSRCTCQRRTTGAGQGQGASQGQGPSQGAQGQGAQGQAPVFLLGGHLRHAVHCAQGEWYTLPPNRRGSRCQDGTVSLTCLCRQAPAFWCRQTAYGTREPAVGCFCCLLRGAQIRTGSSGTWRDAHGPGPQQVWQTFPRGSAGYGYPPGVQKIQSRDSCKSVEFCVGGYDGVLEVVW